MRAPLRGVLPIAPTPFTESGDVDFEGQRRVLDCMIDQGVDPTIVEMTAYFPSVPHGLPLSTERISSAADVAVLQGNISELGIKQIAFAADRRSAKCGSPLATLDRSDPH